MPCLHKTKQNKKKSSTHEKSSKIIKRTNAYGNL